MFKVKTSDLVPYLLDMQATQNQDPSKDFGLDIDVCQPLNRSIPCGLRVQAVRDGYGMQMGSVRCGNQNINLGTTELCDACHAVFNNVSSAGSHAPMIEQMQEYVESKSLGLFERCKEFVKDHPYLTATAIAFPAVCALVGYGTKALLLPSAPEKMTGDNSITPTLAPTNATNATNATTQLATEPTTTPQPTTLPTTQATTTAGTTATTVPPLHSVTIRKGSKGKAVVSVITREEATSSCFKSHYRPDYFSTAEMEIDNKCAKPIIVSQEGVIKKGCVVEPNTFKGCVGAKHKKFYYHVGSNIIFTPSKSANQTLSAMLNEKGDVVVNLASPPTPLTESSCMRPAVHDGGDAYVNKCKKTVAFSITKLGKTKTVLVEPRQKEMLEYTHSSTKVTLGENKDLPATEQIAIFDPYMAPSTTVFSTTTKPASPQRLRTVFVQKTSSGKDTVTVLTREKIAPRKVNATSCFSHDLYKFKPTGEQFWQTKNDCRQPILITPKGKDTTLDIVLPKHTKSTPNSGVKLDFYQGSNIGFMASHRPKEKIHAFLMTNDDVAIELTSLPTSVKCIKNIGTSALFNNAPRYNNTCDEPIVLSMKGLTDKWTHTQLFEASKAAVLPKDQEYLPIGENSNIPRIIQKPDLRKK